MTTLEKTIKSQRDCGWNDYKIWLHEKFMTCHFNNLPYTPCHWCSGSSDNILYLVPGIYPDGRMNWICVACATEKYGEQIEKEMEQYANLDS